MTLLALICLILALLPLCLGLVNLLFYRTLPGVEGAALPPASVLIPARNEAERIGPVLSALNVKASHEIEIIVGDDGSTDTTRDVVGSCAGEDRRIRLISIEPAREPGWAGKNNACFQLAGAARNELLIFLDADVVVQPDAIARLVQTLSADPELALLSGFPKQIAGTFWERLLIPLIHLLLLGFLPFAGVRFTRHPMFGTACGQLIAVRRTAYRAAGGHAAFRSLLHDGLHLPRALRASGYHTDLADFTDIASTRMYDNTKDLVSGLSKNAHEAMATPVGLPIWTAILGLGQVVPPVAGLWLLLVEPHHPAVLYLLVAVLCSIAFRVVLAVRFQQSFLGVLLHPLGVAALLVLQWRALLNRLNGGKVMWKGRQY